MLLEDATARLFFSHLHTRIRKSTYMVLFLKVIIKVNIYILLSNFVDVNINWARTIFFIYFFKNELY